MNKRELATVLAALRVYQGSEDIGNEVREIATNGGKFEGMSIIEIDELCMKLNCGIPEITIPDDAWEDTGVDESGSRLLAHIRINGVDLHLEAYEAHEPDAKGQKFVNTLFEDEEHAVLDTFVDGAARTQTINGREYVLVATPFQA